MKVSCPSCSATLNIDDKKIPAGGARIKCPTCQNIFPVKPPPASSSSGLVPLPGLTAATPQKQTWEEESTRVAPNVPLPGGAIPGATTIAAPPTNVKLQAIRTGTNPTVPLPGISAAPAHRQDWEDEATRVGDVPLPGPAAGVDMDFGDNPHTHATAVGPAYSPNVPLPGGQGATAMAPSYEATDDSIPLPGGNDFGGDGGNNDFGNNDFGNNDFGNNDFGSPTAAMPAVPLPSAPPARSASIPLPAPPSRNTSIPLPAPARTASIPLPAPAARTASIPLPAPSGRGNVPLPGGAGGAIPLPAPDPNEFDPTGAVPLPSQGSGTFDMSESVDSGFDTSEPAAAPGGFDFSEAPPPEPAAAPGGFSFDDAPPPPAPGNFDFGAPPAAPAAGGFEFDAPPPPAPGNFDFGAPPPAAAAPGGFDFGAPPPAAPPAGGPMGFGEVDFGGGGGDLEFDPTGGAGAGPSAPAAAAPRDDLEADLSAPLPQSAPAGPVDGLEMLSFIDKQAKEAGAKPEEMLSIRRFHVKRRSGKVFGPFEEAVIVKMLEDGQLLGNEEVSLDSTSWQGIGSEPAFQAVIARLMETPARSQTQAQLPQVDERGPSMDRLKQLYEGRMAAVAVVQSKEPVPFRKRLPMILAGVLAASVIIGGVTLGVATPYGFFALKLLFPAKVKPDTREFGYLQAARKGFLQDSYRSYKQAKDSANQALQIKEYPEARAVWCQAVFYMKRKYDKADPAELEQAKSEIVNIRLLGEKHPEVLKTEASAALTDGQADVALSTIADAVARDSDDLESLFLRAEAYLLKKQPAQAKAEFEGILKKDAHSAKALHGLGLIHKAANEFNDAAGKLSEALEADPNHVASAVELAEIAIIRRKEVERGSELLEKALAEDVRPTLAPSVLGKALALKAEVLVVQGKLTDAVPLFEEAITADKTNPFTNGRLANAYAELNQPEKAAPLFQSAARAQPDSIELTQGYLSNLIILGKMAEAEQAMTAANTRFPGNATLAYLSARVADTRDNAKEAEELYKRAIAADAKIIEAYLYLSRLYMRFRRFNEAGPILEQGLEQAPDDAALRVGMGELAMHERNLERAEREFKKALELNGNSAEAHLGASRVSLERNKVELAASQVEKALELNPRIPGGRLQRGVALWKLGRLDEAISELDAAKEAEPKNTQIVVTLGAVKFDKGDLAGSMADLNSALVAEPSHADANFYMARVKNAKSEHTQAIESMKRALDTNPKNPVYRFWYGRILADARKSDDALAELKLALEIDPKYADALETMGRIYFDRNDFKKAVEFYRKALEADRSRVQARALIGDAQMKMEDWSGAIDSYMEALDADPDLKQAYSRLGTAYQEKKQFPKAIEWYRKAVQAEPENAEAWLALGYLFKDTKKKKDATTAFNKYLELKPEAENKREVEDEILYLSQ